MVFSAIQIGSISFVDEGVDQVLDFLGDRVGINALFVATQAFDRGVAGRQVTRKDHPGHGGDHQADLHSGGSFVQQHDEFYTASILGPYRAKDAEVAHFDALGDVMPAAKSRGMQVYSFMLENTHSGLTRDLPGWSNVLQVDAWGRSDPYACLRNPDYVSWWLGLAEDQVKTYAPDGIMIGSERNGPLDNALSEGGFARDGNAYCFCVHCLRAGAEAGIDARRARQGYLELDKLLRGETSTDVDSSFIQFLRLLGEYPELISWDRLWHEGYELFIGQLYGAIKFNAPNTQVGWHVWHHNAFSPWYRSQVDFSRWAQFSDFLKPVLYNNCAGYRIHHYVSTLVERVFRGVKPQTVYDLIRGVLGYDENVALRRPARARLVARLRVARGAAHDRRDGRPRAGLPGTRRERAGRGGLALHVARGHPGVGRGDPGCRGAGLCALPQVLRDDSRQPRGGRRPPQGARTPLSPSRNSTGQ